MPVALLGKIGGLAWLAHKSASDLAWGFAGFGLAGTSVVFAGYMIAQNGGGTPRVNAPEHLAIFSKPVTQPYTGGLGRSAPDSKYDMMPVGSVKTRSSADANRKPQPAEKIVTEYRIRGLSQGAALVHGPSGFLTVRAGSSIEGLGDVIAIEARGRRLAIITTGGVILSDD